MSDFKVTVGANKSGASKSESGSFLSLEEIQKRKQRKQKKASGAVPGMMNLGRGVYEFGKKEESQIKMDQGVLGGLGYVGASLLAGVGGMVEGIGDLIGGTAALLSGDKLYAKYIFSKNTVGEWHQKIEDAYQPGAVMDFIGDVGQGIGNSAVMAVPYVGKVAFFAGAIGQGVGEAVQSTGEVGLKEYAYGATVGALEGLLESVIGAGGKAAKSIAGGALKSTVKNGVRNGVVKSVLSSAAGEFAEEFATEYASTFFKRAYQVDPNAQYSFKDAAYAGLVGFVSGGVMSGTTYGISAAINERNGASIRERGNVQTLLNQAKVVNDKIPDGYSFRGEQAVSSLRGSLAAYEKLAASGKANSARGDMLLGEMQAAVAQLEVALQVDQRVQIIKNADEASVAAYAKAASQYLGQEVTADMIRGDVDGVASAVAIVDFVNGVLSDSDALRIQNEVANRMTEERAPVLEGGSDFDENSRVQVWRVGDQYAAVVRNERENGVVSYSMGLGESADHMRIVQHLTADTVRRQMDKLVSDAKATERQAANQQTADGLSAQPTASAAGDTSSVGTADTFPSRGRQESGASGEASGQGVTNAVEAANDKGTEQNATESEKKAATRADGKARTKNIRETGGGQWTAAKKKARHSVEGTSFTEDKYYARQIDKWENLKEDAYITVGVVQEGSPLHLVGLPTGKMYFDVSKIQKAMDEHGDHLDKDVLKKIPDLLNEPIVIVEYKPGENTNTVNVYGKLMIGETPVVVGVMMRPGRGGNVVTHIRTVHERRDFAKQITDDSVLYLNPNKKETLQWFQACGNLNVPKGGTKFGLIRSIAYSEQNVKRKNSHSVEDSSNQQTSDDSAEEKRKARQRQAAMAGEAWEASRANREGNLTMIEELRTEARTKRAVKAIPEFEQLSPEIRRRVYSMMESAEQNGVDERTQRRLAVLLANDAGLEIRFDAHIRSKGFYCELSGGAALMVIHADALNGLRQTLTHELVHELQNQPGYERIHAAALKAVGGKDSEVYQRIRRAVVEDYTAFGEQLSEQEIEAEVVARIIEQQIDNAKFWSRFRQHKGIRGAIDFIRELGSRMKRHGTKDAKAAATVAEELADAVWESVQGIAKRTREGVNARGQSGGTRYYITHDANGYPVAVVESDIFANSSVSPHQTVANYIAGHIGDHYPIVESGQQVYIGTDLPSHYTQSIYTQRIIKSGKYKIVNAKNQAAQNLGEMIEIATDRKWEKTKHTHNKDARYGMYKYTTRFAVPAYDGNGNLMHHNIYVTELVIRNASDGKKYLYDIQNIKKESSSVLPPARHSVDGKGALDESKIRTTKTSSISLDNSIPQNSEMSTGKSKHSVENFPGASKQQTSVGVSSLLSSLGIKGAVPEIKENLTKLQRMAGKADADPIMVKKTVKTLAMSMAREVPLRSGESYETAAVRIRDRLLSWVEANEIKAETVRANRAERSRDSFALATERKRQENKVLKAEKRAETTRANRAERSRDSFALAAANERRQKKELREELRYEKQKNYHEGRIKNDLDFLNKIRHDKDYTSAALLNSRELNGMIDVLLKIKTPWRLKQNGGDVRRAIKLFVDEFYNPENKLFGNTGEHVQTQDEEAETLLWSASIYNDARLLADRVGKESENDALTLEEMKALERVIKEVTKIYREFDQAWVNGKRVLAKQVAADVYADMVKSVGKNAKSGTLKKIKQGYFYRTLDARAVFRELENYSRGGRLTALFDELQRGEIEAQAEYLRMIAPLQEFIDKTKGYEKRLTRGKIVFDGHEVSVGQAITIYQLSRRTQAMQHLQGGGIKWEDAKGNSHELRMVTEAQIAEIKRKLSSEDMEFISLVDTLCNEAAKQVKADADKLYLGHTNILNSFYFPIQSEQSNLPTDISNAARVMMQQMMTVYNISANKDTNEKAYNQLYIGNVIDVVFGHARQISNYAHLYGPLTTFSKVYNAKVETENGDTTTIRKLLDERWPVSKTKGTGGAHEYLTNLLADIQGARRGEQSMASRAIGKLRQGLTYSALGANIKTVLSQLSSYPMAFSYLDIDSLAKGLSRAKGKKAQALMDKYCTLAYVKNTDGNAIKAAGVLDQVGKVGEKTMIGISAMDRQLTLHIFHAARYQIAKERGLSIDSEECLKAAGELATNVMLRTQSGSLTSERSAFMRSTNELERAAVMFTSDAMKHMSRLWEAVGTVRAERERLKADRSRANIKAYREAKSALTRTVTGHLASSVLFVLIGRLFVWLYDKEDDEGVGAFIGDLAMQEIGMLPFIADIASLLMDGYEANHFTYEMVNNFGKNFAALWSLASDAMSGKDVDDKKLARELKKLALNVSQATGIPLRNAYNTFYGLLKRTSPENAYKMNSLFYDATKADLSAAIESGDEQLASTVADILAKQRTGEGIDNSEAIHEIVRLYEIGENVLPSSVPSKVTIKAETEDEEDTVIVLDAKQKKAFTQIYSQASGKVPKLIGTDLYKNLSDEEKAKAIKLLYDSYYDEAAHEVAGVKASTLNALEVLCDRELLVISKAAISAIEADKNKRGEAINGSRKKKVLAYVKTLKLPRGQAEVVLYLNGYRGDAVESAVVRYANTQGFGEDELAVLAELLGGQVVRGKIVLK